MTFNIEEHVHFVWMNGNGCGWFNLLHFQINWLPADAKGFNFKSISWWNSFFHCLHFILCLHKEEKNLLKFKLNLTATNTHNDNHLNIQIEECEKKTGIARTEWKFIFFSIFIIPKGNAVFFVPILKEHPVCEPWEYQRQSQVKYIYYFYSASR